MKTFNIFGPQLTWVTKTIESETTEETSVIWKGIQFYLLYNLQWKSALLSFPIQGTVYKIIYQNCVLPASKAINQNVHVFFYRIQNIVMRIKILFQQRWKVNLLVHEVLLELYYQDMYMPDKYYGTLETSTQN